MELAGCGPLAAARYDAGFADRGYDGSVALQGAIEIPMATIDLEGCCPSRSRAIRAGFVKRGYDGT